MEGSSDKLSKIKNVINNPWGVGLLIGVVYSSHLLDELHIQYLYIYIRYNFHLFNIYKFFSNILSMG